MMESVKTQQNNYSEEGEGWLTLTCQGIAWEIPAVGIQVWS